ncbi:MAG: D-alanine--D-alanine ligase [Bacteroidota bacterium]
MKLVGIICGGFSSEYEISLKSAKTIAANFPQNYQAVLIMMDKSGWRAQWKGEMIDFDIRTMTITDSSSAKIDAAVIYTHGDPGENGKIQALLEMQNIPYVNSGVLASALSFDKWYCNQFLKNFGINVAKSIFLQSKNQLPLASIIEDLGLPLFVKPSDSGSSYGISKVKSINELEAALEKAFAEGNTVVIESFLAGTEVTCGVYKRRAGIHALPLTEIATENEFFDFEAKYLGQSQEITPARIADEVRDKVQEVSKFIYELLQLRSIARIDFMLVDDVPFVIEVNTTPGFSPASLVPQMIEVDKNTIQQFWTEIFEVELQDRYGI